MSDNAIDFKQIPITALKNGTKNVLCMLLNPYKIFSTDEGLPRDWRGLAQLAGIPGEVVPAIANSSDRTNAVLSYWSQQNGHTSNVHNLQIFLERLDRFDVLSDAKDSIESDAEDYLNSIHESKPSLGASSFIPSTPDQDVLTVHDAYLSQQGASNPQMYDAFVLFADEDIDFALELIERMEALGFKLCVKERDLLGGLSSQHSAMLRLISERCTRLIVIISPDFLQSPANTFFIDFAQAFGIEQRQRKIVPCLYKRCNLPPQLSYYFLLDYQRSGRLWNFWDKLRDSLRTNPTPLTNSQRATIREIESVIPQELSRPKLAITNTPNIPIPVKRLDLPVINVTPPDLSTANSISSSLPPYSPPIRQSSSMVDLSQPNNNMESTTVSLTLSDSAGKYDSVSDITSMVSNGNTSVKRERMKKKWYSKFFSSSSKNVDNYKDNHDTLKKKKSWQLKKALPLAAD